MRRLAVVVVLFITGAGQVRQHGESHQLGLLRCVRRRSGQPDDLRLGRRSRRVAAGASGVPAGDPEPREIRRVREGLRCGHSDAAEPDHGVERVEVVVRPAIARIHRHGTTPGGRCASGPDRRVVLLRRAHLPRSRPGVRDLRSHRASRSPACPGVAPVRIVPDQNSARRVRTVSSGRDRNRSPFSHTRSASSAPITRTPGHARHRSFR
jgi:hypothetical protein